MKRKLVLLGLLVLTSGSLFAQNTVKISGKVQFVGADKKVSVIQNNGFERITLGETEIGPYLFADGAERETECGDNHLLPVTVGTCMARRRRYGDQFPWH